MSCKRVTIKLAKGVAAAVAPEGLRFITAIVSILQETDLANGDKREIAVQAALAEAKAAGRRAKESAIRSAVEATVFGLKELGAEIEKLGQEFDPAEPVTA